MKFNKIRKLFFIIFAIAVIGMVAQIYYQAKHPSTIRAFGDLTVDFGLPWIPPNGPIFTLDDFKPGDCTERNIKVTNDGQKPAQVAVRGIKTDGFSKDGYFLENILNLVINNGVKDFYNGKLDNFFTLSGGENGLFLDLIPKDGIQNYNFKVCFPKEATNEYQALFIKFDLIFGTYAENYPRMTGGGSFLASVKGINTKITHGFELHCNPKDLPNNLEINWGKKPENNFHLTKLTSASCTVDPNIDPKNPKKLFNTYIGEGVGKLNNIAGASASWTFTDAGEPGKNDTVMLTIKDKNGNIILNILSPIKLSSGNHQAH